MSLYKMALEGNYVLTIAVTSWFLAQVLKTIINMVISRKFNAERLLGAGGMPSSHSALVCSMVIATAKSLGVSSPIFAIATLLALVVMYDAMGVRRETGRQAKVLNTIILNWLSDNNPDNDIVDPSFEKLKEFVGHTPFEVIGGAILGIVFALAVPIM